MTRSTLVVKQETKKSNAIHVTDCITQRQTPSTADHAPDKAPDVRLVTEGSVRCHDGGGGTCDDQPGPVALNKVAGVSKVGSTVLVLLVPVVWRRELHSPTIVTYSIHQYSPDTRHYGPDTATGGPLPDNEMTCSPLMALRP